MPSFVDRTGQNIKGWVVKQRASNRLNCHNAQWLCVHACGNEQIVNSGRFTGDNKILCSVCSRFDLTSHVFGKWAVLGKGSKSSYWICKCECGLTKECNRANLLSGHSKGCRTCTHPRKLAKGRSRFNSLLHAYKFGAEDRGLSWELSEDKVKELISLSCQYCRKRPEEEPITRMKYTSANGVLDDFPYNGIDRVDNKLGYTEANSVPCCRICNRAKSSLPAEVFRAWIQRLRNTENGL